MHIGYKSLLDDSQHIFIVVTCQYTLLYILCVFHEESDTKEKFVIKNLLMHSRV